MLPSITETTHGDRVVLSLAGDFDLVVRDALAAACLRTGRHDAASRVQVDLSEVGYIDCHSLRELGALLRARHAIGDPAILAVPSPFLREMLRIVGLVEPGQVVRRLDEAA